MIQDVTGWWTSESGTEYYADGVQQTTLGTPPDVLPTAELYAANTGSTTATYTVEGFWFQHQPSSQNRRLYISLTRPGNVTMPTNITTGRPFRRLRLVFPSGEFWMVADNSIRYNNVNYPFRFGTAPTSAYNSTTEKTHMILYSEFTQMSYVHPPSGSVRLLPGSEADVTFDFRLT